MQEDLRNELKKYKNEYGTTLAFIGRQIGVHRCTLSLFINNKRELATPVALKLNNFLKERIK